MYKPQLRQYCATGIVMLLAAAQADAQVLNWTPSVAPPMIDGTPAQDPAFAPNPGVGYSAPWSGYGNPGDQTVRPPMPPMDYAAPGYPPVLPERTPYPAPKTSAGDTRDSFTFAGLGLTQHRSDEAYSLDIDLNGLDPARVKILPAGFGLMIAVEQSAQTDRSETFADGRGFRRSYSWSGGTRMKRLPVPPDGDLAAMLREDGDDGILILIPRRQVAPATPPTQQPDQTTEQQ